MSRVFVYVVDRDFGFAPNPFHGACTLATCKPGIRRSACVGDCVVGMGGRRLNATGRCIFAMWVTEILSFNEYWTRPEYLDKRPVRSGSNKMLVGDNIYHFDAKTRRWKQADSHHSHADGSVNGDNLRTDTSTDRVLISRHFYYFGSAAPAVPAKALKSTGYRNGRNYRVYPAVRWQLVFEWLQGSFGRALNGVQADPFDLYQSEKRYSVASNRVL